MDLEVDREPVALEPLDEVHLPGGAVEIDRVAVEAGDQDAELPLPAGRGESRAPHVVLEVERCVRNPRLEGAREEIRVAELQVPRGLHGRVAPQLLHEPAVEVARAFGRRREGHERTDVHHRFAALAGEEASIERVEGAARRARGHSREDTRASRLRGRSCPHGRCGGGRTSRRRRRRGSGKSRS